MSLDPLDLFLPPVARWFRTALGTPTPVQTQGWPVIAAGQNALLLAPTGSGKTLAAFLACLDGLWRQPSLRPGVQILYISPLKALNNDIYRNLQVPLDGVAQIAREMGFPLPRIEVAVRTGDTPSSERQRLLRKPPHVLITTPESLHLLLTSKARETLRGVSHCIVDEIHALCSNKRGVFLALLLERLQVLNPRPFVRIGLSATQRPLEEVARFLGGLAPSPQPSPQRGEEEMLFLSRPVTIVDAGLRKDLDLKVLSPVEQFGPLPEKSIWPSIYRVLANLVSQHRSTIIFANNRRSVERITNQLNELIVEDESGARNQEIGNEIGAESHSPESWLPAPDSLKVRAHHGSVSLEVRQQTEQALKEGRLRAVVATGSLELGIDMGAVDLVCQVESPGSVARGLQRVGRAGHLVGQQSKGRLIPKTLPDLLDEAVLAAEMAAGRVEEIQVPINCLDVLAQQVVAMVAMDPWDVPTLFVRVRQAYPYRNLTPQAFDAVLQMVSGRFSFSRESRVESRERGGESGEGRVESGERREESGESRVESGERKSSTPHSRLSTLDSRLSSSPTLTAFQPRISWDRIHNRLLSLPGSQKLALVHGGTIPDTGQYAVYTHQGLRLGELDEEFIYERRVGDTFLLGTSAWRIDRIEMDRVLVNPAEGTPAMVPFWRGEKTGRSFDLGLAQGRFLRTLAQRLDDTECLDWLSREHFLDRAAARNLRDFVRRQVHRTGCVPSDKTLLIEASRDPLGDWQVLILSPLGSRLHLTLRLALENVLHRRLGYSPQSMHHDDGIVLRMADSDEPILDVLEGITPENVEELVLDELADSALFALRFRQNAARALLMPRGGAGKRAPLWLQRLRGRDLLQVARRHADFPIVAETFRECLHDHLDVPRLQEYLRSIQGGGVEVRTSRLEVPSPFAASLLFAFTASNMYQYDDVEAEPGKGYARLDQDLLNQLVGRGKDLALDPRAVHRIENRLRGVGRPPRTSAEMAEWLRRLGDLALGDLEGPMDEMLRDLEEQGTVQRLVLSGVPEGQRWVLTEEAGIYETVFGSVIQPRAADINQRETESPPTESRQAAARILFRFLETHALVSLNDVLQRYPFEAGWARSQLEEWVRSGRLVPVTVAQAPEPLQWSAPENFANMQRGTLAMMRREVITCPAIQFADFVVRWQNLHPETRAGGHDGLAEVLHRLEALTLPANLWEQTVLPGRVPDYQPSWLDGAMAGGQWIWFSRPGGSPDMREVGFLTRSDLEKLGCPQNEDPLDQLEERLLEALRSRGAQFVTDLAQTGGANPGQVRSALWRLARLGLVSNDQFDVVRRGEVAVESQEERTGRRFTSRSLMRPRTPRSRASLRPEGRWSMISWGHPGMEEQVFYQARLLLQRFGIVARELALLDPAMPPWRVLYEILSRLELAGEVRRGYFVEGLSGAQFALPEAARRLHDLSMPSQVQAPAILMNSLDPANLYGAGAPFECMLRLGNGVGGSDNPPPERSFSRRPGNWLVLKAGKPLLFVEQHGKRLTTPPGIYREDLVQAVACLPGLLPRNSLQNLGHKLTVEEWNNQPVTAGAGRDLLEAAGFVRDYQAMTLYAVWRG